jgi:hypothetical protein
MANISKTLEQELKALNYSYTLFDKHYNDTEDESLAVDITVYDYNDGIGFKTFKLPKNKEVSLAWVMGKMNTEKIYQSFAEHFGKILKQKLGYSSWINIYPTTYGIGIFVALSYRSETKEIKEKIDKLLTDNGIQYKNQSSDAGWVFRYVISKERENIKRIEKLIQ